MKLQRLMFLAVAIAALGAMSMAQSSAGQGMGQHQNVPSSMSTSSAAMKSPDHRFIKEAAQGGMAEVELGNLAQQNSSSAAVKEFGNRMVTDHTKANDGLRQIADQKGITLPTTTDAKDEQTSKMLESKQGAAFDKAYMRDMVKDHEADIAAFRHEAEYGKDPQVKAWAQQTLPVLEEHLSLAKKTAGEVGVESTRSSK